MKLPLTIEVIGAGYGKYCDACREMTNTTEVGMVYRGAVLRQTHLCPSCIENGVEIDLNVELGPDPERSKETKRRIKKSRELEKARADDLGGRPQPGSGNTRLAGYRGDIRCMGSWRVEHKFTESLVAFKLKLGDLAQIVGIATDAGENPALIIEFSKAKQAFAVIPFELFMELASEAKNDSGPRARRQK